MNYFDDPDRKAFSESLKAQIEQMQRLVQPMQILMGEYQKSIQPILDAANQYYLTMQPFTDALRAV